MGAFLQEDDASGRIPLTANLYLGRHTKKRRKRPMQFPENRAKNDIVSKFYPQFKSAPTLVSM